MKFPDLSLDQGLQLLEKHLLENSFVVGFSPTQADITVYRALAVNNVIKYENISRWYNNIKSFGDESKQFPPSKIQIEIEMPEKPASNKKEVPT
jgi:elongation factor 1-beta